MKMRLQLAITFSIGLTAAAAAQAIAPTNAPGRDPAEVQKIEKLASDMAGEMSRACPAAAPNDVTAFNACRARLFEDSLLRRTLVDFTLWGRQRDPKLALKETNLTQFGPDVLTGMYISLFMFDGKYKVDYVESEKLYRVELASTFRNRMAPGEFPYPFWHEDAKWQTYQNSNSMLFFVDPETTRIKYALFTAFGTPDPTATKFEPVATREFDGKWLWTDANGKTQPQITLFDGLFSAENPNIVKVDATYRDFALSLREGTCMNCHVPNNPNKMKRLVLLQSPAHAASEIERTIKIVSSDKMPLNDFGIEYQLKSEIKGPLLDRAQNFAKAVADAKAWEADRKGQTLTGSVKQ